MRQSCDHECRRHDPLGDPGTCPPPLSLKYRPLRCLLLHFEIIFIGKLSSITDIENHTKLQTNASLAQSRGNPVHYRAQKLRAHPRMP